MVHFKISLAGQLHFAPHAGDWGSLFVSLFVLEALEDPLSHTRHLQILNPQNKTMEDSVANIEGHRGLCTETGEHTKGDIFLCISEKTQMRDIEMNEPSHRT